MVFWIIYIAHAFRKTFDVLMRYIHIFSIRIFTYCHAKQMAGTHLQCLVEASKQGLTLRYDPPASRNRRFLWSSNIWHFQDKNLTPLTWKKLSINHSINTNIVQIVFVSCLILPRMIIIILAKNHASLPRMPRKSASHICITHSNGKIYYNC